MNHVLLLQLEENKKEKARLKQQYDLDRRRRWRMLEESGDLEQAVREVYGWEDGVVLALPTHVLSRKQSAMRPTVSAAFRDSTPRQILAL